MASRNETKEKVILYLLDLIDRKQSGIVKRVTDNFQISEKTVYGYLKELDEKGILTKTGRAKYELVEQTKCFEFSRSKGEIVREEKIIAQSVKEYIQGLPGNVKGIWDYALGEMINNVIDHSECEKLSIILKQDYMNTKVYILDDGVGIFEKIKNYFQFDDLDDSVNELFKGKLTTDSRNHSGEGIFFTSRIMDDFMIISSGKSFAHDKYEIDVVMDDVMGMNGTAVMMRLNNNSRKQVKEVFDRFADVDGGFTITRVPIKNMFPNSPVSRSEAKRLCARLENFRTVELDFAEVEWIGQGFAHQIFVVFQNNNPEIKLVPLHMNTDVEKMYHHVLA